MKIVNILVILFLIYLFFVFFPGFFGFLVVFSYKKGFEVTEESIKGTYYEPFAERFLSDKKKLQSIPKEDIHIKSKDGLDLAGTYLDNHSDKTILFVHGYKSHYMDQCTPAGRMLYDAGYNLLFICGRGHGISGGKCPTMGIKERDDVCLWVEEMKRRGHKRIFLCGISMGSVAIAFASKQLDREVVKGLILDCGYCSPSEQISTDIKKWGLPHFVVFPLFPIMAKLFLKIDLNESALDSIKEAELPALIIHGMEDHSVAFKYGEAIYENYAGPKEKIFVPGADHTVCILAGGEEVENKILSFIENYI